MNEYKLSGSRCYTDLYGLAKDIYLYPGRFWKAFNEDEIMRFIETQSSDKCRRIAALKKKNYIPDVFLFKASYILNPYMELRYHGLLFDKYDKIGAVIKRNAPKIDVYIKDLLRFDLLKDYMVLQGDDKKKPETFSKLLRVCARYNNNHNLGYFLLGYALDNDRRFYYNGECFNDPKDFLQSRCNMHNLFEFASSFETDCAFIAWLETLGYSSLLDRYNSVVKLIERKEKECLSSEKISNLNENSDPLVMFYKEYENN